MMYKIIEWWSEHDSGCACNDLEDCPYIHNYDGCIKAGVTKMVFIPKEGNYVYKVSTKYCEYYDDACAQESLNYHLAQENGLEEFFIPTCYWDTYAGYNIYIQEKIQSENTDIVKTKENLRSGSDYICSHSEISLYDYFDKGVIGALLNNYKEEVVQKLISFVTKYKINDLWFYNCVQENGKIRFFDYAGYGD